jgi:uncharacterized protein (DUF885 family)
LRRGRVAAVALASTMLVAALATLAPAIARAAETANQRFVRLGDEYLDHWLARQPQVATRLGIHDHDDQLVPVTKASLEQEAKWLAEFRGRLQAVPRAELSFERALEYDVLSARLERGLLDIEVIRPYENNPNAYLDMVAVSVQSLLSRDFASPCTRMRSAARRLAQVPEVLRAARINLGNPPRIATETAISQYRGLLQFYRKEVPALARACKEPIIQGDVAEAAQLAIDATEEFVKFLEQDLLPRSTGSYALGKDVYQRKLACDEMETTPVDSLLARGLRALDDTQRQMEALADSIAPGRGVQAVIDDLEREAPTDRGLVPFVAGQLDSIRSFVRARGLLTVPERENLMVRETPIFLRSLSFASMNSPGVWERKATEAYYYVTPVDSSWTDVQKRDHLAFFNRYASSIVSVHEALPGHYYQFLALQKLPSRLRQSIISGSNAEGWAHYCEQMAVEQGFGGGDPRFRLMQQALAIRRIGRLIVGISLHTQGMTYEQAVELFQNRCYMAPVNAQREARRGTMDPTYLVYTLGKWHILDLRAEVQSKLGARFDLKRFHDAYLAQGGSPFPVVRAGLLRELGIDGSGAAPHGP